MKKILQRLFILSCISLCCSCEAPIDRSDVFPIGDVIEITLDFDFQESTTDPGYIQFNNLSKGFQSFQWNFGYNDDMGNPVTSKEVNPYIFFPENWEYVVTLTGIDFRGEKHRVRYWIPVVNRCC